MCFGIMVNYILLYHFNSILQYVILLLLSILQFVTVYYQYYQDKEVASKYFNTPETREVWVHFQRKPCIRKMFFF